MVIIQAFACRPCEVCGSNLLRKIFLRCLLFGAGKLWGQYNFAAKFKKNPYALLNFEV